MGFYFRKSVSFGPVRFNLSKSGLGASLGVKGARITAAANGTTYITVGSHGFYYRQRLDLPSRAPNAKQGVPTASVGEIPTVDVETLRDSTASELVEQLNRRAQISLAPAWLLIAFAVVMLLVAILWGLGGSNPAVEQSKTIAEGLSNDVSSLNPPVVRANKISLGNLNGRVAVLNFWTSRCKDCQRQLAQYDRVRSSFHSNDGVAFFKVDLGKDPIAKKPGTASQNWSGSVYVGRTSPTVLAIALLPTVVILDSNGEEALRITGLDSIFASTLTQAISSAEVRRAKQLQAEFPETKPPDTHVPERVGLAFLSLVGLGFGSVLRRRINNRRRTTVIYELDPKATSQFATVQQAFGNLSKAARLWRITSSVGTYDWKRNAGSTSLINRRSIRCGSLSIPDLSTNVSVIGIDLGEIRIYPLPDQILYWQRGTFAPILYSDLRVSFHNSRFIETESVPLDARVVGETWRYVNKNGGPDRRFNNNIQLPMVAYGGLNLSSTTGVNLDLQVSSLDAYSGEGDHDSELMPITIPG